MGSTVRRWVAGGNWWCHQLAAKCTTKKKAQQNSTHTLLPSRLRTRARLTTTTGGKSTRRQCGEGGCRCRRMQARVGGCGGTISLKPSGEVGVCFSTPRMAWACARGEEVRSGIDRAVAECGEKEAPLVEVVSV